MNTEKLYTLPKGWVWTTIYHVVDKMATTGKKLKQSLYHVTGKVPVIDQGQNFIGGYSDLTELALSCNLPVIVFGDHTKIVKYVNFDFIAGADGIKILKPLEVFNPKLFYFFLNVVPLPDKGYARHSQFLEKSPIPLPPLLEQHRIVAKIEELFAKLEAGVEALKKVKVLLKRYRQSVLKSAFEGKLTQVWREAHRHQLEAASVLLERIKEERKKILGRKYKELPPLDTSELPELPEGWVWARLDLLGEIKGGITKDQKRQVSDGRSVPYLRVANVQRGYLDMSEIKEIEVSESIITELILKHGDILFTEGGDRDKLGRGWIWHDELPECIHQNHIFRMRLFLHKISNKLISWYGNTFGVTYFMREGKQTTNLASVNLTKLSALPVTLPSLLEQQKIVEEIERHFSIADEVEMIVDQSLKQAERLRQSILKAAFEGNLVPQDPDDEPAEKLLERIKEEKARKELENKNKKTKKKLKKLELTYHG